MADTMPQLLPRRPYTNAALCILTTGKVVGWRHKDVSGLQIEDNAWFHQAAADCLSSACA